MNTSHLCITPRTRTNARARRALCTALAALALCGGAAAQRFGVDPALSTLDIQGEVLGDSTATGLPGVPFILPAAPIAVCPLGPPAGPFLECQVLRATTSNYLPNFFDGVRVFNFGNLAGARVNDLDLLAPAYAIASFTGASGVDVSKRTLIAVWNAFQSSDTFSEGYLTRGCVEMRTAIAAELQQLRAGKPIFIRYEWSLSADGQTYHECPGHPLCGLGIWPAAFEDPEFAEGDLTIDIAGNGPGNVIPRFQVNSDAGLPGLVLNQRGVGALSFPSPPATLPINIAGDASARLEVAWPGNAFGGLSEDAVASMFFRLRLRLVCRYFNRDMATYMRRVPGGPNVPGPDYDFLIGQYEITNAEYSDFLNDAELDGGATPRGEFMSFAPSGDVTTQNGEPIVLLQPSLPASRLLYEPLAPLGTRYDVEDGFEDHPVVGVSWIGALKFCNWLTLEQGMPLSARCYTEGPSAADWRPVTISAADWAVRDLNQLERAALVTSYPGFRLPMDNLPIDQLGWISNQSNEFNEWHKASAYDPQAPPTSRSGPQGETLEPYHWIYGFGRDVLLPEDANYLGSTDPYDDDDAPVGFFNSATALTSGVATNDTDNPYQLYDMSGNVAEWGQDQVRTNARRSIRSGAFDGTPNTCATTHRQSRDAITALPQVGFRVLRVPGIPACPGDLNGDRMVDSADLGILLAAWQFSAGGDLDGDGDTDSADLGILLANWGRTC